MPIGQMHDAGIVVAGGSDWPVSQIRQSVSGITKARPVAWSATIPSFNEKVNCSYCLQRLIGQCKQGLHRTAGRKEHHLFVVRKGQRQVVDALFAEGVAV